MENKTDKDRLENLKNEVAQEIGLAGGKKNDNRRKKKINKS